MSWIGSFFGSDGAHKGELSSPVDVVTYVASLASKPSDIDPILDKLRGITSHLQKNESLSDKDQEELAETYLKLEEYLAAKDPLRSLSPEALHKKISDRLRHDTTSYSTFWRKVGFTASSR